MNDFRETAEGLAGESRGSASLSVQSAALLTGRGIGFVFAFAVPIVLVRALDQSVFGQYKQYFLVAVTAIQLSALGLPWSLYYFLPVGGARRGRFVTSTVAVLGSVGATLFVLAVLFGGKLAEWMSAPDLAQVVPLLGAYSALALASQFAEDLAVIEKRPLTAGVVVFSAEATRASLLIVSAILWGTLEAIAWASIIYGVLRLMFVAGYATHLYGRSLLELQKSTVLRQFRYAGPFGLAVIVTTAHSYLHQYYVAGVSDPSLFAIYAVGCFQIPLANIVYAALADVALVRITEYHKTGRKHEAFALYSDLFRLLAVFFIPLYVLVVAFAPEIIGVLFTPEYLGAVPVLVIFSTTLLLYPAADHVVLRAYNETRFIFAASVLGLMAQAASLIPLYRSYGIVGVAVAYVLGLAVVRIAGVVRACQLLSQPFRAVLPIRALVATVVSSAASVFIASTLVSGQSSAVRLLLGALLFCVGYTLLGWRLGVLKQEEKARIRKFFYRVIGWVPTASRTQ